MPTNRSRRTICALLVSAIVTAIVAACEPSAAAELMAGRRMSADPIDTTPTSVVDGEVRGIAVVGDYVYVGGSFQTPRPFAFRYREATGVIDQSWAPVFDGDIRAVEADRGLVYFGGSFQSVDGIPRRAVAQFDAVTGALTPFDARVGKGRVYDLAARSGFVVLGGNFTRVQGAVRERLAIVGPDGALQPFAVPVQRSWSPRTTHAWVSKLDVTPDGRRLVIGGNFVLVGGASHPQLAVIDLVAGRVEPWYAPQLAMKCSEWAYTYVRDIDIAPNGTFFVLATTGGYRTGPSLCDAVARFQLTPPNPASVMSSWYAFSHGDTFTSVLVSRDAVYVGGHFRKIRTTPRQGLGALHPTDGKVLDWNPGRQRGYGVLTMHTTPTRLYIGHDTDLVGGERRPRIAAFDLV